MKRLPLLLFLVVAALVACTDTGPTQAEFNDAVEGVPSDPDTYELTVVSCENDGEFIRYTWGLKNLTETRKTYAFDPHLMNSEGVEEKATRELVSESVAPGEYRQWDGAVGRGERFPLGTVECRFEVVDSVLGEFRDEG